MTSQNDTNTFNELIQHPQFVRRHDGTERKITFLKDPKFKNLDEGEFDAEDQEYLGTNLRPLTPPGFQQYQTLPDKDMDQYIKKPTSIVTGWIGNIGWILLGFIGIIGLSIGYFTLGKTPEQARQPTNYKDYLQKLQQ